jgi:xanthine dehydrogenase YagT iron-sulfur-binding subunit
MGSDKDEAAKAAAGGGLSRRQFLRGVGVAGAGAVIVDHPLLAKAEAADAGGKSAEAAATVLEINGEKRGVNVEPRTTLLNVLRNHLEPPLTGTKLVCDAGTCGACTVLMDGKPVYACMVLAVDAVGKKITTIEGLGTPEHLSPVQEAFCEKDALMCGFCTPGFVTTITALLQKNPDPSLDQVKEACKGNFCRCGTYPRVFEAALAAARGNK